MRLPEKKERLRESDVSLPPLFGPLSRLTKRLHSDGNCPNRVLHFDELLNLLLLMFFNPVITSLRDLSALSALKKVRSKLGAPSFGKSTIAEAMRVFDPSLLSEVVAELSESVPERGCEALKDLRMVLECVDGSLLRALPRMAWAIWIDEKTRAAKLHAGFDVLRGVPTVVDVTDATARETDFLLDNLERGHLYITDRGYAKYSVFQDIMDAGASFVCRIKCDSIISPVEERSLTDEDHKCGVVRDRIARLGNDPEAQGLKEPVRVVEIETDTRDGRTRMLLATDRFEMSAEIVALIYRHRWKVELFFRWLKHTLNFSHLMSDTRDGVTIQIYAAIIATLMIAVISGRKPNKRLYVMISLYLTGIADEDELMAVINALPPVESLPA
jgi:hypothetical protein